MRWLTNLLAAESILPKRTSNAEPLDAANQFAVRRDVVLLDTGGGPAFSEVAVPRIAEETGHRFVSAPDRLAKVSVRLRAHNESPPSPGLRHRRADSRGLPELFGSADSMTLPAKAFGPSGAFGGSERLAHAYECWQFAYKAEAVDVKRRRITSSGKELTKWLSKLTTAHKQQHKSTTPKPPTGSGV